MCGSDERFQRSEVSNLLLTELERSIKPRRAHVRRGISRAVAELGEPLPSIRLVDELLDERAATAKAINAGDTRRPMGIDQRDETKCR
jgi:hypothetical protein